jgi:hypothetical protein
MVRSDEIRWWTGKKRGRQERRNDKRGDRNQSDD